MSTSVKRIYLSGSFIGLCDDGAMKWQRYMSEHLKPNEVIDGTNRGWTKENHALLRARMKKETAACDLLIAYFDWSYGRDPDGHGYHMDDEMHLAKEAKKPVILITKRGYDPEPYWMERCDFVEKTAFEAMRKAYEILNIQD